MVIPVQGRGFVPVVLPAGVEAPRLLDRVRAAIRVRHYSLRTEEVYIGWIRRFILFHQKRHPAEMTEQPPHFLVDQHHRQSRRLLGAHHPISAVEILFQHRLVEEQQCRQSLVLGGGRDIFAHGQVGEKLVDL
jgi:Phage integrase, N-terminal SAM-like domain